MKVRFTRPPGGILRSVCDLAPVQVKFAVWSTTLIVKFLVLVPIVSNEESEGEILSIEGGFGAVLAV